MVDRRKIRQSRTDHSSPRQRATGQARHRPLLPVVGLPRVLREAGNAAFTRRLGRQAEGQPLEPTLRARMERAFGTDLGYVRIHDDARAEEAADALGAMAFTHGQDIILGSDAPSPTSPGGQELLAHELTHVVQQDRSGTSPTEAVNDPSDAFEAEAARAQRSAMAGQPVEIATPGAPPSIQRQPQEEGFVEEQLRKLLDKALEEGIQYDSKDGWKVGGVPVREVPRGVELVERLLKGDVEGAVDLFNPRDPNERERYREKTAQLRRKLDLPSEEGRQREREEVRDVARREAERFGPPRKEEPRFQLREPTFNLRELGIRPGSTTQWVFDRFRLESAALESHHRARLNDLADQAKARQDAEIEIVGHADTTGKLKYNKGLSERRANAVRDYLIARGVEASKIKTVVGRGEEEPLIAETNDDDRARNRRVEILFRTGPTERKPFLRPPRL